jgi:hypothetical protein
MKLGLTIAGLVLLAAPMAMAKDAPRYTRGVLVSVDSKTCEASHIPANACQAYVLEADHAVLQIRARDGKEAYALQVGSAVQFRLEGGKLFVRYQAGDRREREYTVVSVRPRQDSQYLTIAQNNQ